MSNMGSWYINLCSFFVGDKYMKEKNICERMVYSGVCLTESEKRTLEYYWRSRKVGDTTIWDDIVPAYVSFRDGPVVAIFESNEPNRTITNRYQQQQHDFAVTVGGSDYLLGASNKTLMRMLKERLPLAGKTLKITRSGHGFETQFTVEEAQHKKHWRIKPLTRLCGMTRTALVVLLWLLRELLD